VADVAKPVVGTEIALVLPAATAGVGGGEPGESEFKTVDEAAQRDELVVERVAGGEGASAYAVTPSASARNDSPALLATSELMSTFYQTNVL